MSKASNLDDNVKNSAYGNFGDFKLIINELDRNEDIFEFKLPKEIVKTSYVFLLNKPVLNLKNLLRLTSLVKN